MMATVPHVISGLGLRKFQADGFLLTRGYYTTYFCKVNFIVSKQMRMQSNTK